MRRFVDPRVALGHYEDLEVRGEKVALACWEEGVVDRKFELLFSSASGGRQELSHWRAAS